MFTIQKDRQDFAGAISTLNRISDAKSDPETLMEVLYRKGELYVMMSQMEEAILVWESIVPLSPKSYAFRLQGLIKLGEEYETRKLYAKAVRVYYDLCKHAPQKAVKTAACQRAKGLKSFQKGSAQNLEEGRTQIMPQDKKKIKRQSLHGPSHKYIEYHNSQVLRGGR